MPSQCSHRRFFVVLLVFTLASTLSAQVTIREKVTIDPKPAVQQSSTLENDALFAPNPETQPGRDQSNAMIVLKPCVITATGSLQVSPDQLGLYPSIHLVFHFNSVVFAGYFKGLLEESLKYTYEAVTATATCGMTVGPVLSASDLWIVNAGERSISGNTATFSYSGLLIYRFPFTATATLTAVPDGGRGLGSISITPQQTTITKCDGPVELVVQLRDTYGRPYDPTLCGTRSDKMTVSLISDAGSAVSLSVNGGNAVGNSIIVPASDSRTSVYWNPQTGDPGGEAVVRVEAMGQTASATVTLSKEEPPPVLTLDHNYSMLLGMKNSIKVQAKDCGNADVNLPQGALYRFAVLNGTGYLRDPVTGQEGTLLASVQHSMGKAVVEYHDTSASFVPYPVIEVRTTESSVQPVYASFEIRPTDLVVTLGRKSIAFGDTTSIKIKKKNADGTFSEIPTEWLMITEIADQDTFGFLYPPDSTWAGPAIFGNYPVLYYYAKGQTSPPDSVEVIIRVTAYEPSGEGGGPVLKVAPATMQSTMSPSSIDATKLQKKNIRTRIKADKENLKSTDRTSVAFEDGPGGEHVGFARLVVKNDGFDHFEIALSRDTLRHNQTADLRVTAVNKNGTEVPLDTSTGMILRFADGGPFVDFIRSPGDTVQGSIEGISYGTLRAGSVKIVAAKKTGDLGPINTTAAHLRIPSMESSSAGVSQDDPKSKLPRSTVFAFAANDMTKVGLKDFFHIPEIKALVSPDSIKPFYPGSGATQYFIDPAESRTNVTVAVTVSGRLYTIPPSLTVSLTSIPVEGSGGHAHTGNRPTGYFGKTMQDTVKTQEFSTGTDTIRTSYLASLFGGKEKIIASLADFPAIADTTIVMIKIPGLLPFSGNGSYTLGGELMAHPKNHYLISQNAIDSLIHAANEFAKAKWNTTGKMKLNDMSLEWGGLFDIDSNWRTPHSMHRIGRSVDVENLAFEKTSTTSPLTGKDTSFTVPKVRWVEQFQDFMETTMKNWDFEDEHQMEQNVFERTKQYPHFEWKGR